MGALRRGLVVGLVVGVIAALVPSSPSWALTDTVDVGVSATVPLRAEISIIRDANSVTRGTATGVPVVFDRYDDQDGQTDGSAFFMYAPYRSETNQNWHLANIVANGSSMDLTASVTGTAGGADLADILDVFCGGFFEPVPPPNSKGGASTDWELLNGFSRHYDEPIIATAPFNYRLRLQGVAAGTHSGNITYTLVSTP